MKHPQLSRAADLPTMCLTIGTARLSGPFNGLAVPAATSCDRMHRAGRERPGFAPRRTDNQETR
ncbi:hypothetical protein E2P84_21945 [Burkholderia cepacia]|uniref:Uncharacterized protein n=1 Tax=Burkholderia cepacia TaxID=292 RepID=A0AAX2RSY7_BURCE|nr:hypothetical protein DF050_06415 [Burkholderia cepacia]TES73276.1 hypothetical protein E2P84_21945 [Burkholderia cepacia]TET02118.1 hypothetical protein E3D36_15345 [Burkholderia cepacia]TEU35317.1 hypothetical protein E3D38_42180 [Burkholderia cepacia]TEU44246.1 hypothetical protein E3D39_11365 [Burkholderia cepacia]